MMLTQSPARANDVPISDAVSMNSLLSACAREDLNAVRITLTQNPDIVRSVQDESGRTALIFAAESQSLALVALLLQFQPDLESCYNFGKTALFVACELGNRPVAELLLRAGANANAVDQRRRSVLQRACYKGVVDVVTLLLDSQVDILNEDETGSTAMHDCCSKGHTHIATLLHARCSAAIHAVDQFGRTPLNCACLFGHLETAQWLARSGAQLQRRDQDGRSDLHLAAAKDNIKIVKYLMDSGYDIHATANNGYTALHLAASKGCDRALLLLLEGGANVDCREQSCGLTPLMVACDCAQLSTVSLLIDKGADVEAVDQDGNSAMQRCCSREQWQIAARLRGRGALSYRGYEVSDFELLILRQTLHEQSAQAHEQQQASSRPRGAAAADGDSILTL